MRRTSYGTNKKQLGIIAAVVVAVIFILTVIIIQGSKANNKFDESTNDNTAKNDMREELNQISEYLDQLDTTVINNQESLEEINSFSEIINNQFSSLDKALADIDALFVNFISKYETNSEDVLINLTTIQNEVDEVRTEMNNSQASIEALIKETEAADVKRQEEIRKQFADVSESISEVQSKLALSYESLVSMLDILQLDMDEKQVELITMLTAVENNVSNLLLNEIAELSKLIYQGNQELQIKIDQDVKMLSNKMTSLHNQIVMAQEDLTILFVEMESNDGERQEEINIAFLEVRKALEEINQEYQAAYTEIKDLLMVVQEMEAANHEELIAILGEMEISMEDTSKGNLTEILNTMSDMQENYNLTITQLKTEMNQSFENLDASVSNQLNNLTTTISNQYTGLTNIIDDGLRDFITNSLNGINTNVTNAFGSVNQKLESVFRFVSSGKKLLASSLLTKGVTVSEDATFAQIADAILNIPQKLVIGMEELPGEISYEYHFHLDKNGNITNTNTHSVQGGCYNNPIYHVHQSSCYKDQTTKCNCSGYSQGEFCGYHAYDGWPIYKCKNCPHANWEHDSGKCTVSSTSKVLVCGKTTSTVEYYTSSCGLSNGQIVGARIIYNR